MMTASQGFKRFTFEEIQVGMQASYSRKITENVVKAFADLSGDDNPIHLDPKFAQTTRFKKRIAHGMLSPCFFSTLFGTQLPGSGCIYVSQSVKFLKPVFLDDTVTATVTVKELNVERKRIFFQTRCHVEETLVIDGDAEIYFP